MTELVEERDGRKVYGFTENGKYLLRALTNNGSRPVNNQ
jgi:DNA-binding PadR family transcriptional regulator